MHLPRAIAALSAAAAVLTLSSCATATPAPISAPSTTVVPSGTAPASPVTAAGSSSLTPPSVAPSPTSASPRSAAADAVIRPVPASEWRRVVATGAWHTGCPASRASLRRVEVDFHGFDGRVHRGALVVNADVATSVARIFTELFDHGFPIHRMRPIEDYAGDDAASMADDNTSAYNCRRSTQANAPAAASPHANGRAVDLNPYENPWIDPRCGCWQPDRRYGAHRQGIGVIVKGGTAWTVFTRAGWVWQDNATTDLQHFDTGYPSRPLG